MAWTPVIIAVAPNGAYKQKSDHAEIPITTEEIAATAGRCLDAGASMIHLHVRAPDGRHVLDADAYRDVTRAIRAAVGDALVVQITSEAAGRYTPDEQAAVVYAVRPEAVSIAPRELIPDAAHESSGARLFAWLRRERVMAQVILYSVDDVRRWRDLLARGVIEDGPDFVLFVLGRYTKGQVSDPADLIPFLSEHPIARPWSVCAFGPREAAAMQAAIALGGHARVGMENNLYLPDGSLAPDNAALVSIAAQGARAIGRPIASAAEIRAMFR